MPEIDNELKQELEKVEWQKYVDYGSVKVQIKAGQLTMATIERTIQLNQHIAGRTNG